MALSQRDPGVMSIIGQHLKHVFIVPVPEVKITRGCCFFCERAAEAKDSKVGTFQVGQFIPRRF